MAETSSDTTSAWQALLQQADDAFSKELLCLQRRYHGKVLPREEDTDDKHGDGAVRVRCFVSLSDPDLAPAFKGESDLLVTLPATYPNEPAQLELSTWRHRMTDAQFSAVAQAVAERAEELRGTYGIRKLLTWLDNNIQRILQASAPPPVVADAAEESAEPTAEDADAKNENPPRSDKPCRYLMRGKCNSGDKCRFSHEKANKLKKKKERKQARNVSAAGAKDASGRSASPVESKDDAVEAKPSAAETAPSKTKKRKEKKSKQQLLCKFFAKGACRDGEQCKFSHDAKGDTAAKKESIADLLKPKRTGITIAVIGELPAAKAASRAESPQPVAEEAAAAAEPTPKVSSAEDWTAEQQRALDLALKQYSATMEKKERWMAIAGDVDGKSLNDCIDRFKLIGQLVKTGAPIPIALSVLTVTPPPPPPPPQAAPAKPRAKKEEDEETVHAKIVPEDKRVPIETEPEARGAQIRLEELFLYQIGTLVPHCVVCQMQCAHCPLKFDARLSLAAERAQLQKWCPRCSAKHVVALRPVFTHAQSNVLAYVDTENCAVVDVLPSDVLASCLECGKEALLERIVPGRRAEQACFACHTKLAVMTKRVAVGQVAPGEGMPATAAATAAKSKRPTADSFVLGQPLPRNGACDHYRHSHRWFRFQCCGKAFACDVCHDASDCAQANTGKIASKVICGFCSKEQASSVKECACGNEMGRVANRSRHWEGGQGCRDPARMSANDRQKFRGQNKTESQKHKRVGTKGKAPTARGNGTGGEQRDPQ